MSLFKKIVLIVLIVGQFGLMGCTIHRARSWDLSVEVPLVPATSYSQSSHMDITHGLRIGPFEEVMIWIAIVVSALTIPLWGPFYLIHEWLCDYYE